MMNGKGGKLTRLPAQSTGLVRWLGRRTTGPGGISLGQRSRSVSAPRRRWRSGSGRWLPSPRS